MALADDRLSAIRVKVERGLEHIRELKTSVVAFHETRPYQVGLKRAPETRRPIYYVSGLQPAPIRLTTIASDALQNLRSALDHLAYQLAIVGCNGTPPKPRAVFYPISEDATKHAAVMKTHGKAPFWRQDAVDAIEATKPYLGGNDVLWRLHELNRIDKHRLLVTVGSAFHGINLIDMVEHLVPEPIPAPVLFRDLFRDMKPLYVVPADKLCPLKIGDELFQDAPDAPMKPKMEFRFDVAFGEPGVVDGASAVSTLTEMATLVDNLIVNFKPQLI